MRKRGSKLNMARREMANVRVGKRYYHRPLQTKCFSERRFGQRTHIVSGTSKNKPLPVRKPSFSNSKLHNPIFLQDDSDSCADRTKTRLHATSRVVAIGVAITGLLISVACIPLS